MVKPDKTYYRILCALELYSASDATPYDLSKFVSVSRKTVYNRLMRLSGAGLVVGNKTPYRELTDRETGEKYILERTGYTLTEYGKDTLALWRGFFGG